MRDRFIHPLRPSYGETRLLAAAIGVGVFGGLLSFFVVTQMGKSKILLRTLSHADLWFVVAGILGALGGLYMARGWFGYCGLRGHIHAVCGVLVISFVGPLIGGTLALPFYGTMFGPMMFGLTLISNPILGLLWLGTLFAAHALIKSWRRERETLFIPLATGATRMTRGSPSIKENWLTPSLDRSRR